jgi:diaminohydroxyphosphoribosylaminopyrimidine deaminase/5-amino-6-(5-phosphoribosylamino)uracil reductase
MDLALFNNEAPTLIANDTISSENHIKVDFNNLASSLMNQLHNRDIQSVIIEGGSQTLNTFIESNIWDEARVFTSSKLLEEGVQSPTIQSVISGSETIGKDTLTYFINT